VYVEVTSSTRRKQEAEVLTTRMSWSFKKGRGRKSAQRVLPFGLYTILALPILYDA